MLARLMSFSRHSWQALFRLTKKSTPKCADTMCGVRKSKASLSRPAESFAKVRVDLPRLFGGPVCPGFEGREGEGRRERCHLRFQLVSCGRQSRLPKLSSEIPPERLSLRCRTGGADPRAGCCTAFQSSMLRCGVCCWEREKD